MFPFDLPFPFSLEVVQPGKMRVWQQGRCQPEQHIGKVSLHSWVGTHQFTYAGIVKTGVPQTLFHMTCDAQRKPSCQCPSHAMQSHRLAHA